MGDIEPTDCSEAGMEEMRRAWAEDGVPYQADSKIGTTDGERLAPIMCPCGNKIAIPGRRGWREEIEAKGWIQYPDGWCCASCRIIRQWEWAPVTPEMWERIKPRHIEELPVSAERQAAVNHEPEPGVINFTFVKPCTRVMIHIAHMDGTSHDIGRFDGEYAEKLEAARQAIHGLFMTPGGELSMQSVIAQAADAKGVKREDLCLYLMCLGLMRG